MVFRLDDGCCGIKHLPGGLLILHCYGLFLYEGLEVLPVFSLKHHLELFPASSELISFICINVEGFKVVEGSCVEHLPVLRLMGRCKAELEDSQHGVVLWDATMTLGERDLFRALGWGMQMFI